MENLNVSKILEESKEIYRQFLKNEASKDLKQDEFIRNMKIKYSELNKKYPSIINISAKTVMFERRTDIKSLNFFFVTFVNFDIKITSFAIFLNFVIF